jgi:hypothetical protein
MWRQAAGEIWVVSESALTWGDGNFGGSGLQPQDASFDNPLCEIANTKNGPTPVFPNKLAAAALLSRLTGWNSAEKLSVEADDSLSAFLRQIASKMTYPCLLLASKAAPQPTCQKSRRDRD